MNTLILMDSSFPDADLPINLSLRYPVSNNIILI